VIPSVSQLFATSEVSLPVATQALIATSNFVMYQWPYIMLFILFVWLFFVAYKNTETGRANIDHFLLGLPLV